MESTSEKKVYEVGTEIENINKYAEQVAADISSFKQQHPKAKQLPDWIKKEIAERDKKRAKLPFLRTEDQALRQLVEELRVKFYPGDPDHNRINPPALPLAGTGSLEEMLVGLQGTQWPGLHELLPAAALKPPRSASGFGGTIWDIEGSMEQLGLKITQAASGVASGGGGEDNTELTSLLREIAQRERKGRLTSEVLAGTLERFESAYPLPYAGKFHEGGVVPGPVGQERAAIVQAGETVRTIEQEMALAEAFVSKRGDVLLPSVETHIHGHIVSDRDDPVETVLKDPRTGRVIRRTRGGRVTAGGPRR
jgi:hypothetical protein